MIRASFLILVTGLVPGGAVAQGAINPEQELRELDARFITAIVKNDRAMLAQVYAADYYCIHSNGVALNRTEELAQRGTVAWTVSRTDDVRVRIYGDVGIVTGRLTLAGSATSFAPGARRYTDIYVKRGGQWQLVGCQSTLVPDTR